MKTFFIYNFFELYSVEADFWEKGRHRHEFYELIYIEKGTGVHTLNSNEHQYAQGDIYFLTPGDQHSFYTLEPVIFHCIRFLPEFFSENNPFPEEVFSKFKNLLKSHNLLQGKICLSSADQEFFLVLTKRILAESNGRVYKNELIVRHCIILILEMIHQNLGREAGITETALSNKLHIDSIIIYIRQHIANNEKLKKKAIADYFNLSVHYVGEYFRKHTGISIREYICTYKLNIIDKKLRESDLSFSQIGHELGFTDESHFYKFIKIHTGMSPGDYRAALGKQAVQV